MVNSKSKGSKNERSVARVLEDWTQFEMVRVPASGGLGWSSGLMITGDVIPADPSNLINFPFSIEAKVRNRVDFKDPLLNKSDIEDFYKQAYKDAKKVNKIPMVLFRMDRMKKDLYFVIIPYKVFRKLKSLISSDGGIFPFYTFSNIFTILTSDYLFNIPYLKVKEKLHGFDFKKLNSRNKD